MQIRVDHRTRTVHFGSDLTGSQSYNAMEVCLLHLFLFVIISAVCLHQYFYFLLQGPHLQDMPSEQIRQQLMLMLEVLDKGLKTIHPNKIKIENNALRNKIVEAYHASKNRDHQRILARQKLIEDRKVYLEELNNHREKEEARKKAKELEEQVRKIVQFHEIYVTKIIDSI